MRIITSKFLVLSCVVMMALPVLFILGCDRGDSGASSVPAEPSRRGAGRSSPEETLAACSNRIDECRVENRRLLAKRETLVASMERMVDAMREKMPGADDAAVKAELEKDPEWNSLYRRVESLGKAVDDNRMKHIRALADQRKAQQELSK